MQQPSTVVSSHADFAAFLALLPATFDGQRATAVWSFKQPMGGEAEGRVATVTVAPGGDALNVTVVNAFPKRAPNERRTRFVRAQ